MKTLFTIALLIVTATANAETLAQLLDGVASRVEAVLDQYKEVGNAVNVSHGDHAGKVLRTYDYSVVIVQSNGARAVTTQRIYVYDKGGDNETAVLGDTPVQNQDAAQEDSFTRGKAILRYVIENDIEIAASILGLPGDATYQIDDYLGLPDIMIIGQPVARVKIWLNDGSAIIRSPQFVEVSELNPLGFEFWKVAE